MERPAEGDIATCANTEASFGHRGVSSDGSPAVKAARPSKRRVPHESMAAGWVVCDRPRGAWWQLLALRAACRPLCDLPVRRQCLNSSCSVSCQSTTSPPFRPKVLIFGDTSDAWEVPASDLRSRGAPHGEGGTQRARSLGWRHLTPGAGTLRHSKVCRQGVWRAPAATTGLAADMAAHSSGATKLISLDPPSVYPLSAPRLFSFSQQCKSLVRSTLTRKP